MVVSSSGRGAASRRQVKAMDILESIPAVKRSKPSCLAIVKTIFNEDRQACWRNDDEFDSGDGVNFKIVQEGAQTNGRPS